MQLDQPVVGHAGAANYQAVDVLGDDRVGLAERSDERSALGGRRWARRRRSGRRRLASSLRAGRFRRHELVVIDIGLILVHRPFGPRESGDPGLGRDPGAIRITTVSACASPASTAAPSSSSSTVFITPVSSTLTEGCGARFLHTMIRVTISIPVSPNCTRARSRVVRAATIIQGAFQPDLPLAAPATRISVATDRPSPGAESPTIELTWNWDPEDYGSARSFRHLAFESRRHLRRL